MSQQCQASRLSISYDSSDKAALLLVFYECTISLKMSRFYSPISRADGEKRTTLLNRRNYNPSYKPFNHCPMSARDVGWFALLLEVQIGRASENRRGNEAIVATPTQGNLLKWILESTIRRKMES
jgi:hypothetical protein